SALSQPFSFLSPPNTETTSRRAVPILHGGKVRRFSKRLTNSRLLNCPKISRCVFLSRTFIGLTTAAFSPAVSKRAQSKPATNLFFHRQTKRARLKRSSVGMRRRAKSPPPANPSGLH